MFKRNAMFTRTSIGQAIVLTAILAVIAPASFARDRASSTRTKAAPASISQKQAASTNTKAARPKAARRVKEAQRFERLADRKELLQRTLPKAGAHVFDASAWSPRLGDAAPTRKPPGDLARKRSESMYKVPGSPGTQRKDPLGAGGLRENANPLDFILKNRQNSTNLKDPGSLSKRPTAGDPRLMNKNPVTGKPDKIKHPKLVKIPGKAPKGYGSGYGGKKYCPDHDVSCGNQTALGAKNPKLAQEVRLEVQKKKDSLTNPGREGSGTGSHAGVPSRLDTRTVLKKKMEPYTTPTEGDGGPTVAGGSSSVPKLSPIETLVDPPEFANGGADGSGVPRGGQPGGTGPSPRPQAPDET